MLDKIIEIIKQNALFFGDFELASGKRSKYYIDMSKVTFKSKYLHLISSAIVDAVDSRWDNISAVGGPAIGAIPLVSGVLTLMGEVDHKLNGFFVRKEPKTYGKNDLIEGHLTPGDYVVLIEDVTTTGHSLLKACKAVEEAGGIITQVITVLDRKQGAKELFEEKNITFKALISIEQVLNTM